MYKEFFGGQKTIRIFFIPILSHSDMFTAERFTFKKQNNKNSSGHTMKVNGIQVLFWTPLTFIKWITVETFFKIS